MNRRSLMYLVTTGKLPDGQPAPDTVYLTYTYEMLLDDIIAVKADIATECQLQSPICSARPTYPAWVPEWVSLYRMGIPSQARREVGVTVYALCEQCLLAHLGLVSEFTTSIMRIRKLSWYKASQLRREWHKKRYQPWLEELRKKQSDALNQYTSKVVQVPIRLGSPLPSFPSGIVTSILTNHLRSDKTLIVQVYRA